MSLPITRLSVPAALAATSLLLVACGEEAEGPLGAEEDVPTAEQTEDAGETPDEAEPTEETGEAEDAAADEEATAAEGDGAAEDEGSAEGTAEWANPVTAAGEPLGTIELGDVTVEAFQVAVDQATRSSIWADPETDEPIVSEGDDVVVLNYVITNHGDPVILSYGLVETSLRYTSWPYMQQPSVADFALMETHGVNDNAVNTDALSQDTFELGTGEQYSIGEVVLHQPGEEYSILARFTARDEDGERIGEEMSGEFSGTME